MLLIDCAADVASCQDIRLLDDERIDALSVYSVVSVIFFSITVCEVDLADHCAPALGCIFETCTFTVIRTDRDDGPGEDEIDRV